MKTFELFIDKKISVWERTYTTIEAETLDEAIQKCLDGDYEEDEYEVLYDTSEALEPDIDGATYEIYVDGDSHLDPVYTNSVRL